LAVPLSRRDILLAAGVGLPEVALAAPAVSRKGSLSISALRERTVRLVVDAQGTADGAGVKLRRALGARALLQQAWDDDRSGRLVGG
jgi:hypothetical protein